MVFKRYYRRYENWILPFVFLLILAVFLAVRWDYYYDLNDDSVIRDITQGYYTGVPETRNIQMMYLLSAPLAMICRLTGSLPVYGGFLWLCQFGSLYLIMNRSLTFTDSRKTRLLLLAAQTILYTGMYLYHLVFVQYTVTAGMLAAAGIFWFLASKHSEDKGLIFLKRNIPAVLLCFTAFLMRSEMLLLLLPLIAVAGICRWGMERPVFTYTNARNYSSVFAALAVLMALAYAADASAYSSEDWKTFNRLFDARTEVYDYQTIPTYDEDRELFEELGLSPVQAGLLSNYNYGASDEIDAQVMETIAAYANRQGGYFRKTLPEAIWSYRARLTNDPDSPYHDMPGLLIEAALVVFLLAAALIGRKKGILWQLVLLGLVRSVLWLFIILRDRTPQRITDPLYFAESILLFGLLLIHMRKEGHTGHNNPKGLTGLYWLFAFVIGMAVLPGAVTKVSAEYERRETVNQAGQAVLNYCQSDQSLLYLEDVYSTVDYSEKMFITSPNSFRNVDLLGGWLCKSPLVVKKLQKFGYASMEEAITMGENVRILAEPDADLTWLEELLVDKGIAAEVVCVDVVTYVPRVAAQQNAVAEAMRVWQVRHL